MLLNIEKRNRKGSFFLYICITYQSRNHTTGMSPNYITTKFLAGKPNN